MISLGIGIPLIIIIAIIVIVFICKKNKNKDLNRDSMLEQSGDKNLLSEDKWLKLKI